MADELLFKRLSEEIAELRRQTEDNDQRLAGNMATMVVLTKEQARQLVRHFEVLADAMRRDALFVRGEIRDIKQRPPTLTEVRDVTASDEKTQTVFLGQPWWGVTVGGKRIPSKWVARGFGIGLLIGCVLLILLGMGLARVGVTPGQVVKTAAPLVAP